MGVRGGERIAVGCNGERGWSGGTPAGSAGQPACSKARIKPGEGAGLDGRWWWGVVVVRNVQQPPASSAPAAGISASVISSCCLI